MYRNTYAEINLLNIKKNTQNFIKKYDNYKYYFGVVKADCYGHNDIKTIKSIIAGGCNYLAVSSLEEALEIRKHFKKMPILCFGYINSKFLKICKKNNITVSVNSLNAAKEICKYSGIKVHIKLNTGMNRLGINNKKEFTEAYNILENSKNIVEGIYSHIYDGNNKKVIEIQYKRFEEITADIDLNKIPIVHILASIATMNHKKKEYENGCRLGLVMYGLESKDKLSTFRVISEVIQMHHLNDGIVGYNGLYKLKGDEYIAVVSIGYADGIIRANSGRNVYINNKPYQIIGNICMDMLFVKVDKTVFVGDKVEILRGSNHIIETADYLNTTPLEILCSIGKRVPRIYIKK